MSVTRIVRYAIRIAAWATPHIQRYNRERQVNRTEADIHLQARNYAEAERCLALHLEEAQRPRCTGRKKLEILLDLADAQRFQGKESEAGQTFADALSLIDSQKLGSDGRSLYLDRFSQFEADRNHFESSEKAAQEALDLTLASKTPDPPSLASRMHALAVVQNRAGRPEESRETLKKAMNLYEQAYGPDHPDTAARLADLAEVCRKEGKYDEAKQLLERALKVHQRTLGPTSQEALRDLLQLALVLEAGGDVPAAIERFERAFAVTEKIVGSKGADEIEILSGLGRLYVVSEHYPKALEAFEQLLRHLGRSKDERVANAYESLAFSNRKLRRWKDAELHYTNAVAMWKKVPGEHGLEAQRNLNEHAAMLRDLGRDEAADRLLAPEETIPTVL